MAYITDENGNYKRTVRCSHCYEKGHNKSACKEHKKSLHANVERYTKELAEDNFTHSYMKANAERYLAQNKHTLDKMAKRGKNRKCGFCSHEGHTRRTCPERKRQVSEALTKTLALRNHVAQSMIIGGFGSGALIQVDGQHLAVVTNIAFTELAPCHAVTKNRYFNSARLVEYQYVVPRDHGHGGRPSTLGMCHIPLHYLNVDNIPEGDWYRTNKDDAFLLSNVETNRAVLLGATSLDEKRVTKFVIDNIVDTR